MAKSERKKLIESNDKIFRDIIRMRDKVCQWSGRTENLQIAHFFTRGTLRLRWDEENACLLNAGVHLFRAHKYPEQFRDFWLKRIGEKRFVMLKMRAGYVQPIKMFDLLMIHSQLKERLKGMIND